MTVEIELEAFEDGFAIDLETGAAIGDQRGLSASWRVAGERRWNRFNLIADPRQSLRDLVTGALAAVGTEMRQRAA